MFLREIINKGVITIEQLHSNTIETSRKPGKHLTLDERGIIQALHQQGHSLRDIAAIVGCAHTTIYNEIRRGTPHPKSNRGRKPQYTAKRGQKAYEEHQKHSRKPLKIYCDDCEPFIQLTAYNEFITFDGRIMSLDFPSFRGGAIPLARSKL